MLDYLFLAKGFDAIYAVTFVASQCAVKDLTLRTFILMSLSLAYLTHSSLCFYMFIKGLLMIDEASDWDSFWLIEYMLINFILQSLTFDLFQEF